jgi:hypothetical protein
MVKNGYEELRILMANRDSVAKRLNSAVNQIHRWVDIVFPELRQVFKIITCTSAIATLRLFPLPKEISPLKTEQIIAGWKQYVKRHSDFNRAEQLIALAKRSVGATQALNAYKLHLVNYSKNTTWRSTSLGKLSMSFIRFWNVFLTLRKYLLFKVLMQPA